MGLEQRVKKHYKALRATAERDAAEFTGEGLSGYSPGRIDLNAIWLKLASVHRVPVRKVKDIVRGAAS
jgi:hypothetical protein